MSIEDKLDRLIKALEDNTEALLKSSGAPASRKADKAPARSSKEKEGPTEEEFKKLTREFLGPDVPNEEFEEHMKAIDPIFDKYKVEKVSELPEKAWQETMDAIADFYAEEEKSRERSRGREDERDSGRGRSRSREEEPPARGRGRSRS